MVQYEYFGHPGHKPRSEELADDVAERQIGSRVLLGFDVVQRMAEDREGEMVFIVYFQSDITGTVWALYYR